MLKTKRLCYLENVPKSLFSIVELLNTGLDFVILQPANEDYMELEKRMAAFEEASRLTGRNFSMILELPHSIPEEDDTDQRLIIKERAKAKIAWGKRLGISYYLCPNIRSGADVLEYRKEISQSSTQREDPRMILSELSNAYSIKNIIEIIKESDGIIINALSIENKFPSKQVPLIINDIIVKCNENNKPVILKKPTENYEFKLFQPAAVDGVIFALKKHTRMSITEVLNTFNNRFSECNAKNVKYNKVLSGSTLNNAVQLSHRLNARVIIAADNDENSILSLLKCNPQIPIIFYTSNKYLTRKYQLTRGIVSLYFEDDLPTSSIIENAEEICQLRKGDRVILIKDDSQLDDCTEIIVIGDVLAQGEGIGNSFTTGRVFISSNFNYPGIMERGDILVFNEAAEQQSDLIRKASVILTKEKTLNTLAAVVGLNLSKPMIIGVNNIDNLRSGEIVTVDTNTGKVYRGGINNHKLA